MYADSALSLIVPLCVITLVFITKRVVLSLFISIVLAGVMISYHKTITNGTTFDIGSLVEVISSLTPYNNDATFIIIQNRKNLWKLIDLLYLRYFLS